MNKKFLVGLFIVVIGCNSKNDNTDLKNEVKKWEIELQLNGEVGPPCRFGNEDITIEKSVKWQTENPNFSFGLDEIIPSEQDFNSDKIIDGFYYFSPCNCVGGNGTSAHTSDIGMLVYSNNGKLLTNKNMDMW